jgi:hypothetical protein
VLLSPSLRRGYLSSKNVLFSIFFLLQNQRTGGLKIGERVLIRVGEGGGRKGGRRVNIV